MSFAVGSLVSARGREWVVLPGGDEEVLLVRPLGGTEDEETGILTSLEPVEPASFSLPDPEQVGDFRSSRLLRDALRLGFRSSAGPFRSFGRMAVMPRSYQLVPLLMALRLDPVRLLIADDVGIGKTIEALLIARELLDQGDIRRLAVLCSPQLAEQWQREMAAKFHIDAKVVLPSTVRRLERNCPVDKSLFEVYPYVVVSTDYIKSDRRRFEFQRTCPEFVIVDEAHTCVHAGGVGPGRQQRHELLKGLAADATRHLLLVTATPHSGKEEAFRALLALLDESFAELPDDLSGPHNEKHRRRLAAQFVQRRRSDIARFLEEETPFPERDPKEVSYQLTPEYKRLFDKVLDLARETVRDPSGGEHRRRVRWWSALALLRSLGSSPAAAADTLRNRAAAADTTTVEEADDVGQRTVLDLVEEDTAEATDVAPGADAESEETESNRFRRRLRELAKEADALGNKDKDAKLAKALRVAREVLGDGYNPIFFCRFIPTAEYLAQHLRDALGTRAVVEAVTGTLPPDERQARIALLGESDKPRVLVATDCLSEGINLQEHFDAVVHYDLSWNPTRHEQREGRVDRFNQPKPTVRTVMYYGTDNRIDGIVLDVLLRKHENIRRSLGVSVPVPVDTNRVVEAIMEGLLLRSGDPEQLQFEEIVAIQRDELFREWEGAAEREKRSRTMFAQEGIKVEEVALEVSAARAAIGAEDDVRRLVEESIVSMGGVAARRDGSTRINLAGMPTGLRSILEAPEEFTARFTFPIEEDEIYLARTHPTVEDIGRYVLDTALDPQCDGVAARSSAIRTASVSVRTTLLLVRFRFNVVVIEADQERALLAEDARALAFEGAPKEAQWLAPDRSTDLFELTPDANIGADQAAGFVRGILEGWDLLLPRVEDQARLLADELLEQHRRVRDAARRKGVRFRVDPHLPPDLLGVYVLLPTARTS